MRTRGAGIPADRRSAAWRLPVESRAGAAWRAAGLAFVLVAIVGCSGSKELEVTYGHRRGATAGSVNGTGVLAGMFEEAGFRVSTARHLTTTLQSHDVIVWAPNDFHPPGVEVRQFFEQWFASQKAKTLVYIGRDYDAAPHYWESVLPLAPASERFEVTRRQARATAQYDADRLGMPTEATMEWFTVRRDCPHRKVTRFQGPWSDGLDVAQADIRTRGLLAIPTDEELHTLWPGAAPSVFQQPSYELLLHDGRTALVSRVTKPVWGQGQIIVVTNGSFLLNLPLVNHEHRKLAGRLIEACESGSRVAFLESGPGDPPVSEQPSPPQSPQAVRERVLLALHWCLLGLVGCFCIFPIFGRPRSLPDTAPAAFVQHVDALGELLKRTRDEQFARLQIDHYHTITRREPNPRRSDTARPTGERGNADHQTERSSKSDTQA